jgi:hypothetical protein
MVREELYNIKVNKTDTFFVQREIDVKEISVIEWEYVFMKGAHIFKQNTKHSNYVSHYGEVEDEGDEGDDDDLSIDSQLKRYINTRVV